MLLYNFFILLHNFFVDYIVKLSFIIQLLVQNSNTKDAFNNFSSIIKQFL